MIDSADLLAFVVRIAPIKDTQEIHTNTLLFASGALSSINILNLIGYVEKAIQRKLSAEELVMKNFATIETIVATFGEKQYDT